MDRVPTDNTDTEGGVIFYPIALHEAELRPLMTKLVFPDCISLRHTKRGGPIYQVRLVLEQN
ncbi:MAG: hypothetical protein WBP83_12445 [Nitrososphaeraceae archaeon]